MPSGAPKLSKKVFQARAERLREQLVQMQVGLREAPFKVLLIVAGSEGAGRGALLNSLAEWLDPRGVETFSHHPPTDEERARPLPWRYWRSLPGLGRIGLYAGSWYTETLRREARDESARELLTEEAERIRDFEKLLADNDTLIVKIWLNLSKAAQGKRLKELRDNPLTSWRVTEEVWHHHRIYDRLAKTAAFLREQTDRPGAHWTIVDAEDERARDLQVGQFLLKRVAEHQRRVAQLNRRKRSTRVVSLRPAGLKRLQAVRLDQEIPDDDYDTLREKWLGRLNRAVRAAHEAERAIVFAFEGWDAAGKGGTIRRLTSAVDPRDYRVVAVAKPTPEEKQAHYLWRFWRDIPADGRMTVFDRSWYGRVLVERLEGFCRDDDWKRAYREINDFELQLTDHGVIVLKYWLHISHEEQLQRFRDREATPHKRHKMNEEDWRNRRKRQEYEIAVGDMLALTDTAAAPWLVIPADDKRFARIEVLRSATRRVEAALGT